MKRNAVLFAPHLDDELLIGGGLLYALSCSDRWNIYIVFMTNGDYFGFESDMRLKEALSSCRKLGIKKDNIFFLGYGDRWIGNRHIYNSDDELMSKAGKTHTYGLKEKQDYSYAKRGVHSTYSRKHIKRDISEIIQDLMPELCITVDFDVHPDHRALSLLFEEVMGEILKRNITYHPYILKKLAYEDVYKGEDDYYKIPHRTTHCKNGEVKSNPYFKWNSRLSFRVPNECDTLLLSKNVIYKAAKEYVSQNFKYIISNSLNSDIVFWQRRTDNKALYAQVYSTSGESAYINDFLYMNTSNVLIRECQLDRGIWFPSSNDNNTSISFRWDNYESINKIVIYESIFFETHITELEIYINGKLCNYSEIVDEGNILIIDIPKSEVKTLDIKILKFNGKQLGISEIEVLYGVQDLEKIDNLFQYINGEESQRYTSCYCKFVSFMAEKIYKIKFQIRRLFPNIYFMQRRYLYIRKHRWLLPIYWLIYIVERLKRRRQRSEVGYN